MTGALTKFGRWMAALAGATALLFALALGAFRLAIDLLPGYQQRIVESVRATSGLKLEFDSVHARIGGYGPEVVFRGARVLPASGDGALVSAESGRVSLSIPRSLWYRRIEVGRVLLVRPRLNFVIHTDGSIHMVGQSAFQAPESERRPVSLDRVPRGIFAVRDATLDVLDLRARQGRFELTGADFDIERSGDRVSLRGEVDLPQHLGSSLEFDADAEGELEDFATIAWRLRADGRGLDFEQWAALLPESFVVPAAGHGALGLVMRGTGRKLASVRLRPQLENLRLPGDDGEFSQVAGDIRIRRTAETVSVLATGLVLSRTGAPWRPTSLNVEMRLKEGRVASATARADYLRLENLAPFALMLPPGEPRERLIALDARGELFGLDVALADAGAKQLPDMVGRVRFADVGFEPYRRAPGLSGLDGAIEGRGAGGVVHVATRNATMKWPLQWRAIAAVPRADGRVEWSRFGDGLRIWLDDGRIDTGHGKARGRLRVVLRPGELPLMVLDATARDVDVRQAWRYLPIEKLSPKALAWLDAAFRAGRVNEGRVSIVGPVRGFPYREGQGEFHAEGRASGVDLFYAPGWPEIRNVAARFAFDGPAMQVHATGGTLGGIAILQSEAHSADLRDAIIAVRGNAGGDAGRAIRLLQSTPLAPSFGAAFADLAGSGSVKGEIAMVLPIKDFERRVVTVMATLSGVALRHRTQPFEATAINGELWVRNREIHAPALSGRLFGGPVQATIATTALADGSLSTQVNAQGRLQGAQLRPVARLPANAGIEGSADWRGFLTVLRNADRERPARGSVRLSSDLRGLASRLPEPFAKSTDAALPLTISANFDGLAGPRIQAQLGRDINAIVQWRSRPGDPPVERGIVVFGGHAPGALPKETGLWLTGRLETVNLSELLDLEWDQPRGRPLSDWFGGANLAIRDFEVLGYRFADVGGRLRPGNRAWELDVTGPAASGHLTVPYAFPGEVPMQLDLERLHFGERAVRTGDGTDPDPRKLPAIRVNLRDFVFDGRRFGQVQAELSRGTAGITLNQFTMTHASYTAEGRGSWLVSDQGAECRFEFEADTGDVRSFMGALQFGSLVEAKHGRVSATLRWPGAPEVKALERLSGRIEIAAEDGSLTSVEPGAGRVFGLMSLAHLPRRLALDFGDLTGEGLAFDTLRGTFQLTDGVATTDNLTLRGSAAEIGIAGRTSLRDRTYDQTAVVTGQLGASLGVAGALAGGPAVGAALLLFSQIFKEPLKGATRGYYRITGSWDDPQVRRIDAREMKDNQQSSKK
jgi:uncharacterized protein (TIGR02099 family)